MTQDILKKRFPKILEEKLSRALAGIRDLDPEYAMELLAKYRRNQAKFISENGVHLITSKVIKPPTQREYIPLKYLRIIEILGEACQELHSYRDGGSDQYAAADVSKFLQSMLAKKKRNRKNNHKEIADFLISQNYETSKNRKAIVLDAIEEFKRDERTIHRVASKYGLTK